MPLDHLSTPKRAFFAAGETLEPNGGPASKKPRTSSHSSPVGSLSHCLPRSRDASSGSTPGSCRNTAIAIFDDTSSDESDDSAVFDLTTTKAKSSKASLPPLTRPARPAFKLEGAANRQRLTPPKPDPQGAPTVASKSPSTTSPFQLGGRSSTAETSVPRPEFVQSPTLQMPGAFPSHVPTQDTIYENPSMDLPGLPRRVPKLESANSSGVLPKREITDEMWKAEVKNEKPFPFHNYPRVGEAPFNPILCEVPALPDAPSLNPTDEEIYRFMVCRPSGENGTSHDDVEEIIKSLPVDERRLVGMPRAKQPVEIKSKLLDHQLQALEWMQKKENPELPGPADPNPIQFWKRLANGAYVNVASNSVRTSPPMLVSGGILADDMGLGKTLEMISLILTSRGGGPTLIVAPKSVMTNWEKQIRDHVTWNHYPKIMRFHSSGAVRDANHLQAHKIIITTYHKLVADAVLLTQVKWRRIILDEGHNIRNAATGMAQVACNLIAQSRWICSGTPIINNIGDLYSLAKFLRVSGGLSHSGVFKTVMKSNKNLQAFMLQFCLRRTKAMSFVNLKIPEKREELVRLKFSDDERNKYMVLLRDAQAAARLFFNSNKGDRDNSLWNGVLERLLRLRQMCDHWSLCKSKEIAALFRADMQERRNDFTPRQRELRGILLGLIEENIGCGLCADTLDPRNQPVLTTCKHGFCNGCLNTRLENLGGYENKCPLCNSVFDPKQKVMLDMRDLEGVLKRKTKKSRSNNEDDDDDDDDDVPPEQQPSTKTKGILQEIKETLHNKKSKIVVFSQWTSFLDILEFHLAKNGYEFTRIDGRLTTEERDMAIKDLETKSNIRILLASLRVAGVGISLVAADTVLMADTWWAPAIEDQAIDRVHRLGQKRPVTVKRLVVEDSLEEKVLITQDRKRELIGTAWQEDIKLLMTPRDTERLIKNLLFT